jgi:hypothetical protein
MALKRWAQRWSARLDHGFFVLAGLVSVWVAYLTLWEGITPGWQILLVVVFWVAVAYLVLPRLHRILTRIYLPDYFIGRTRTVDGLLGDPVNLGLSGTAAQIHQAMTAAGWTRADELSVVTGWRIVTSTLSGRSYPEAPVSPLFLFRRRQDFAYQQEVAGSPSQRHHVRFWQSPDDWLLPGGFPVGWLAAGTYDRSVGLSLFTLQITHKIDADVDAERDHILATVAAAQPEAQVTVLADFFTGYHSRNGGGDLIKTDGDLPILDLTAVPAAPEVAPQVAVAARTRAPIQTVFGVAATALRGLTLLWLAWAVFAGVNTLDGAVSLGSQAAIIGWALVVFGVFDLALAGATLAGHNGSRLLLCTLTTISLGAVFVGRAVNNDHGPIHVGLVPLAISVLVLLALSSVQARSFATRTSSEG